MGKNHLIAGFVIIRTLGLRTIRIVLCKYLSCVATTVGFPYICTIDVDFLRFCLLHTRLQRSDVYSMFAGFNSLRRLRMFMLMFNFIKRAFLT